MLMKLSQRGKLTGRLRERINNADLSTLNDIWMPFREKRCTRADEARKRGLYRYRKRFSESSGHRKHDSIENEQQGYSGSSCGVFSSAVMFVVS